MTTDLEKRLMRQVDELQARGTQLVEENRSLRTTVAHMRELIDADRYDPRGDVLEFFYTCGQGHDVGASPHVPPERSLRLGLRLVAEEVFEILQAAFVIDSECFQTVDECRDATMRIIDEARLDVDLPALADGVIDSKFVLEGLLIRCGINGKPLWDLVTKANLTKAAGPVDPVTGKKGKPPGFVPPDIEGELKRQGWRP